VQRAEVAFVVVKAVAVAWNVQQLPTQSAATQCATCPAMLRRATTLRAFPVSVILWQSVQIWAAKQTQALLGALGKAEAAVVRLLLQAGLQLSLPVWLRVWSW